MCEQIVKSRSRTRAAVIKSPAAVSAVSASDTPHCDTLRGLPSGVLDSLLSHSLEIGKMRNTDENTKISDGKIQITILIHTHRLSVALSAIKSTPFICVLYICFALETFFKSFEIGSKPLKLQFLSI